MLKTIREKTEYLIKNKPDKIVEIMESWADKMKEQAELTLDLAIYGRHILTEDMYDKIMSCFAEKPYFDYSILKEPAMKSIDFSREDFSEYDFMYAINRMHMQFHEIVKSLEDYIYMAKKYLTDSDCPHDPSEKSYCEAYELLKKHGKA